MCDLWEVNEKKKKEKEKRTVDKQNTNENERKDSRTKYYVMGVLAVSIKK